MIMGAFSSRFVVNPTARFCANHAETEGDLITAGAGQTLPLLEDPVDDQRNGTVR
jgi:hypothetical protein